MIIVKETLLEHSVETRPAFVQSVLTATLSYFRVVDTEAKLQLKENKSVNFVVAVCLCLFIYLFIFVTVLERRGLNII